MEDLKDRLEEALVKIQELQTENKELKSMNFSTLTSVSNNPPLNCYSSFQEVSVAHKKTSDSSNNGIYPIHEEEESPTYCSQ